MEYIATKSWTRPCHFNYNVCLIFEHNFIIMNNELLLLTAKSWSDFTKSWLYTHETEVVKKYYNYMSTHFHLKFQPNSELYIFYFSTVLPEQMFY